MEAECKRVSFGAMPELSILIPSYQSGEKLYAALESVLSQEYDSLEIVVCDDGSDDLEESRLRAAAGECSIQICRHETNVGTVRNLNDGLHRCKGTWVLLLGADDTLAGKGVVSALMQRAQETNRDWLTGIALLCDGDMDPTGYVRPSDAEMRLLRTGTPQLIWTYLCRDCFIPSGGTVYRRDFLQRLGGFDTQYRLVEDWPLFLKLVRLGELPELLDIPLVCHRANGVSQDSAGQNKDYQYDLIETMRKEIFPHLDMLSGRDRKEIELLCRDKEAIYRLRFECSGLTSKLCWGMIHLDTVFRKLIGKGRRPYCGNKL